MQYNSFTAIYNKFQDRLYLTDHGGYESRTQSVIKLFKQAVIQIKQNGSINGDFDFTVIIDDTDNASHTNYKSTLLTACCDQDNPKGIPIPDFTFDAWHETKIGDYEEARNQILKASTMPWKDTRAFWIGNPNTNPIRHKLIKIATENKDLICAIGMNWKRTSHIALEPQGSYYSLADHCNFQYLIDVEGVGYSARLKLLLATGRPIFLQDRRYVEYWNKWLVPYEHYIPVKNDLSDMIKQINWANKNPEKCLAIADKAKDFALNQLSRECAVNYLAQTIQENTHCPRKKKRITNKLPSTLTPIHRHTNHWTNKSDFGQSIPDYQKTYEISSPFIDPYHKMLSTAHTTSKKLIQLRNQNNHRTGEFIRGWLRKEDALKIYELAYFRNGNILEIGSHHGLSTTIISTANKNSNHNNNIITVELSKECSIQTKQTLRQLGLFTNLIFHNNDAVESVIKLTSTKQKFGFIFVDHSHTYNATLEFCTHIPNLLKEGGFCLFHDFNDERNANPHDNEYGVYDAVVESFSETNMKFWGMYGCTALYRLETT